MFFSFQPSQVNVCINFVNSITEMGVFCVWIALAIVEIFLYYEWMVKERIVFVGHFSYNYFCSILICARSSGDRASVSGTVCRGFESLRAHF